MDVEENAAWSFRWSFRHTPHAKTGPYQLDGAPHLSSKNGILPDDLDGHGSTSNP
jgi:hypothetical protein